MGSDHYCNWVLPLAVTSVLHVFATDYDTSESNGTSVGDRYVATYKPSFLMVIQFASLQYPQTWEGSQVLLFADSDISVCSEK